MNTANLQLQGLLVAMASLNNLFVRKGLLSVEDIADALGSAEKTIAADEALLDDITPANRDAVCFPVRLLQLANRAQSETATPGFSELARMVGETKDIRVGRR